jgi:hypothetical protein
VEANCPWFGSKLSGTLMSFASGRLVDAAAWRQPRPMAIEIMVSAVMTRGARARVAIEDRSLVILAVPLGHPGIPQALLSQDFRFGPPCQHQE